ncbi:MAG: NADH-quinone oxidoreductase subunit NuoE [Burkholderiales bacterium]|nr:NADH-quinone oxidoreductase subunit NuoE [Burkholderiales bacterium]
MLSAASIARIDRAIAKYPPDQRQSAVMAALAIAQEAHGWLSTGVMDAIARHIGMPAMAVYEVATFYTMYDLSPVGRNKLTLCTNLPCQLQGAGVAAEHLKRTLGIGFGETTADGCFTLKEGECMGACGDAPVMMRNNHTMLSWMTPDRLDALVEQLRAEGKDAGAGAGAGKEPAR